MPYAVTHVLSAIILVDIYRDYFAKHKKYFTLHTVFIAGLSGLLPDIDVPLNWIFNLFGAELLHRTVTHTFLFALIFIIPGIILWHQKKHKPAMYFFVAGFGILTHLLLDYLFIADTGAGLMLFYPLSAAAFQLGLLSAASNMMFAAIDAVLLLAWLWHEEIRHKISDFI